MEEIPDFPYSEIFSGEKGKLWKNLLEYRPMFSEKESSGSETSFIPEFDGKYLIFSDERKNFWKRDVLLDLYVQKIRATYGTVSEKSSLAYWENHFSDINKELQSREREVDRKNQAMLIREKYDPNPLLGASLVKGILEKLQNPRRILDFSSGWGDVLLGCLASSVKEYVGYNSISELSEPFEKLIDDFGNGKQYTVVYEPFEEASTEDISEVDLAFSNVFSPNGDENEEWLTRTVFESLKKSWEYIAASGHLALCMQESKYSSQLLEFVSKELPSSQYRGIIGYYNNSKVLSPVWIWKKNVKQVKNLSQYIDTFFPEPRNNIEYDEETLHYMVPHRRGDEIFNELISAARGSFSGVVYDLTGNIGGATLAAARNSEVTKIFTYEKEENRREMLSKNVQNYGFQDRVTVLGELTSLPNIDRKSIIFVDPPWLPTSESLNDTDYKNQYKLQGMEFAGVSLEKMVVEFLKKEARVVCVNVPPGYKMGEIKFSGNFSSFKIVKKSTLMYVYVLFFHRYDFPYLDFFVNKPTSELKELSRCINEGEDIPDNIDLLSDYRTDRHTISEEIKQEWKYKSFVPENSKYSKEDMLLARAKFWKKFNLYSFPSISEFIPLFQNDEFGINSVIEIHPNNAGCIIPSLCSGIRYAALVDSDIGLALDRIGHMFVNNSPFLFTSQMASKRDFKPFRGIRTYPVVIIYKKKDIDYARFSGGKVFLDSQEFESLESYPFLTLIKKTSRFLICSKRGDVRIIVPWAKLTRDVVRNAIPFLSEEDFSLLFDSNLNLWKQAFTHQSKGKLNYEMMETIGDKQINLQAMKLIFEKVDIRKNDTITKIYNFMISERVLPEICRKYNFPSCVLIDESLKINYKIEEDILESFMGALFLTSVKEFGQNRASKICYKFASNAFSTFNFSPRNLVKTQVKEIIDRFFNINYENMKRTDKIRAAKMLLNLNKNKYTNDEIYSALTTFSTQPEETEVFSVDISQIETEFSKFSKKYTQLSNKTTVNEGIIYFTIYAPFPLSKQFLHGILAQGSTYEFKEEDLEENVSLRALEQLRKYGYTEELAAEKKMEKDLGPNYKKGISTLRGKGYSDYQIVENLSFYDPDLGMNQRLVQVILTKINGELEVKFEKAGEGAKNLALNAFKEFIGIL